MPNNILAADSERNISIVTQLERQACSVCQNYPLAATDTMLMLRDASNQDNVFICWNCYDATVRLVGASLDKVRRLKA